MQSDIDAQLTNFFEEAPPREFATVMRGYDRHQVDEHIRQIETEVRQHREQTQTLRQQLTDAHRQIQEQERPTYSWIWRCASVSCCRSVWVCSRCWRTSVSICL